MIELSSGGLEWLASGSLLLVAGVLIRFRGWTFLLAGYDETSSVPDDVVREAAGNTVVRVGVTVLVIGVLTFATNPPSSLGALVGALILLDVVQLLYRLNSWSPQGA
jgi:uncharacterized membrane protein YidH (DUF202 family)